MKAQSWLWPDHIIGKRESRKLREEHNAVVNSHAELLEALKQAGAGMSDTLDGGPYWKENMREKDLPAVSAAIYHATKP